MCSTGLIGDRLPMDKLLPASPRSCTNSRGGISGGTDAAYAIMTTDTVPKQAALHHADKWNVGGMAKGAGMLAPALATMLCVVTTDAVATAEQLDAALRAATRRDLRPARRRRLPRPPTTPCCCSPPVPAASPPARTSSNAAVLAVCDDLADQMMADAEGVTKRVTVTVSRRGLRGRRARSVARTVARDSLVKTALFGSDPNWGRVLAAVGIAPIELDPGSDLGVASTAIPVCIDGVGAPGAREVDLSRHRHRPRHRPRASATQPSTIRTTDLSHAYVEENSAYSS